MYPFFLFFGGKWRAARHLGRPKYDHVVEPFAGSAGYSCYWNPPKVTLVERDPVICGIWGYLQRVSAEEILRLPANVDSVDELPASVCQEARHLVGMWFNRAVAYPVPRRSRWARQPRYARAFWGETIKLRIASQVPKIRHWKIIHGAWSDAPDVEAHWHVDPPYAVAGRHYRFNDINRAPLGEWCRTRKGFVQVCEAEGASWLPFEPFMRNASHPRVRRVRHSAGEAIYEQWNPQAAHPPNPQQKEIRPPRCETRGAAKARDVIAVAFSEEHDMTRLPIERRRRNTTATGTASGEERS